MLFAIIHDMVNTEQTVEAQEPVVYYEWAILSKPDHERGHWWYIIAGLLGVALVAYSIFTANFLFAVMIVLIAFIIILNDALPARTLQFALTDRGVVVGGKTYPYRAFTGFYIVYEPPRVSKVILELPGVRQDLSIDLNGMDPLELREFLLQVIPENLERETEPLADILERFFKL